MSTDLDLKEAEVALREAEEAKRQLNSAEEDLRRALLGMVSLPLDFSFDLSKSALNPDALQKIAPQDKLPDFTLTIRYHRAYQDLLDAEEELEDTSVFDVNEYRLAELNVEEAKLNLEQTLTDLEDNYLSCLQELNLAISALEDKELSLEKARQRYKTAELQYELGVISSLELKQVEIGLLQAEAEHFTAQADKQLAYQAYLLACEGIPLQY